MPKRRRRRKRDHRAEYARRLELRAEREKAGKKARKTAKKTAEKKQPPSPKNGNQLPAGAHPQNTGGKPGRSGRRPNIVKEKALELLEELELLQTAADIAKGQLEIGQDRNTGEPIFLQVSAGDRLAAIRFLTERAAGRPPQPIVGDEDEPPVQVEELRRAESEFFSRLARLAPAD